VQFFQIIKELRRDRDETRASDRQRIQVLQDQVAQMDRRIEEQVTQRDRRIASLERRLFEQDQELGRLRISSQLN